MISVRSNFMALQQPIDRCHPRAWHQPQYVLKHSYLCRVRGFHSHLMISLKRVVALDLSENGMSGPLPTNLPVGMSK